MLEKIPVRDFEESRVLIIKLLQVRVLVDLYVLVLEGFIHCAHILVDYLSFVLLKLELLL